jgi:predicted acyl esterase
MTAVRRVLPFASVAGMIDAHPARKAVSPQAPVTDWFVGDDFHHNGAFFLPHLFNFLARFDRPRPKPTTKFNPTFDHDTPDGYEFYLKLVDVYPNDYPDPKPNPAGVKMGGYQRLVRGGVMRGKFRDSFEKPEPFTPGKPAAVQFSLPDVYHTFRSGHRIMVQVQSSWFPLADRNPQRFMDIYTAKGSDFRKATQRVYRTRDLPSRVTLPVLP